MQGFIDAYNSSKKATPLYNAVRGHIDFEGIHPFADGNGRVGRTIMNMGLMRDLGVEVPFAISRALHAHSDVYYSAFVGDDLDLTQRVKELTPLFKEAVEETYSMLEVTKLRKLALAVDMNERQKKVFDHLCTMELEGGYKGKFTNQKYRQKAKLTDLKTAQRDLADLVKKGVLAKSGRLKGTHYYLNLGKENALER
jgi:Fic family protein